MLRWTETLTAAAYALSVSHVLMEEDYLIIRAEVCYHLPRSFGIKINRLQIQHNSKIWGLTVDAGMHCIAYSAPGKNVSFDIYVSFGKSSLFL